MTKEEIQAQIQLFEGLAKVAYEKYIEARSQMKGGSTRYLAWTSIGDEAQTAWKNVIAEIVPHITRMNVARMKERSETAAKLVKEFIEAGKAPDDAFRETILRMTVMDEMDQQDIDSYLGVGDADDILKKWVK